MRALATCVALLALGSAFLFAACADDTPAGDAAPVDAGDGGDEASPPDEVLVEPPLPDAGCEGLALPFLSGICASCVATNCCAQATACSANGACQKVIDCFENCTRIAEALDAGGDDAGIDASDDAGGDDASVTDAGDPAAALQACIDTCAGPLTAEVSAFAELTACQSVNCPADCPVTP
ncbi:MAG TPA: hypothetical protein VM580_08215 [Labilithrix sp.]|jgi:hypothetical protein|nr:hypothetical protein [Labilithrix sp.]